MVEIMSDLTSIYRTSHVTISLLYEYMSTPLHFACTQDSLDMVEIMSDLKSIYRINHVTFSLL